MVSHAVIVHYVDAEKVASFIKWEGYRTPDGDFQVHYFDDAFDFAEFVCEVYHTGNVSFVTREEYDMVYDYYTGFRWW